MFLLFVSYQELFSSLLTLQRYERNIKVLVGICFNFRDDNFNFIVPFLGGELVVL